MRRHPVHSASLQDERSRAAVEQTLAAFGLDGSDRLRLHSLDARHSDADIAFRLRAAMEALGPVFRCFGRFIGMRLDLIDTPFWLELGAIEDRAEAAPPDEIDAWLAREIGAPPQDVFESFEYEPLTSSTRFQTHRARLRDGRAVAVKLRRPGAHELLLGSAGLLRLVRGPLGLRDMDRAIAEFIDAVTEEADLSRERSALEAQVEDAAGFEWMAAARPVAQMCSAGALVVEAFEGPALAEALRLCGTGGGASVYCAGLRIGRAEAARLLCTVWLRQALAGQAFAAEPEAERIVFMPGHRLAIGGDALTSLEPEQQAHLWGYVLAAAYDDPAGACRSLIRGMTCRDPGREAEIERRFLQLVPFRDGGWDGADGQLLTHEVFCQWRTAGQMGFVAGRPLTAFYRGFARVALLARRLAPEIDAMREATRELRLAGGCSELFGALGRPAAAAEWMRQYAELALLMPKGIEEALRPGSTGDRGAGPPGYESGVDRRGNSTGMAAALLAAFASASLLAHAWAGAGPSFHAASLAGLTIAGALLLAAIARMG
ncbi:MAG TPA: AarF/UbiB family protein [Bryobacteraceae bacterium]